MSQSLEIELEQAGSRLDAALAAAHPALSRAQWQRLIKEGQVTIAGERVKGSMRLAGGEMVMALIPAPQPTRLIPQDIPLDIRYEDEDLLVINKDAGIVVHPGTGHESGTIVNAVLHHCPDLPGIGGEIRPGIVHRLDKNTSGLLIVAKNERTLNYLQNQFRERAVKKVYLALLDGQIQPPQAIINAPLGRNPEERKRMAVIPPTSSARSREAITRYETERLFEAHSLVRCYPKTGRTHQIRVHLAYVGYPIVGDTVYGRRKQPLRLRRHFLHAWQLSFRRPSDDSELNLEAELPPLLQATLDKLASENSGA